MREEVREEIEKYIDSLNVNRDGVEIPVAFFRCQLQRAQKRYSATELECLVIFKSVNCFAHYFAIYMG